jgi:hypothetical protein
VGGTDLLIADCCDKDSTLKNEGWGTRNGNFNNLETQGANAPTLRFVAGHFKLLKATSTTRERRVTFEAT